MRYRCDSVLKNNHAMRGHEPIRTPVASRINNLNGFSLMELMVSIAVIGILAAVATPSATAWRNNAQFNSAVREVKSAIDGTRMAAIRTNLPANVTFDGTNTFTTQTRGIVAGVATPGAAANHQLEPGATVNANNGGVLTFNNRGMASNMTVTIDHTNGLCRQIVLSIVGSSRIVQCP